MSLVNKHLIPREISLKRPAAFKRGPTAKPKSLACKVCAGRLAISSSAKMPGAHCLA